MLERSNKYTRISTITEKPRDALYNLKIYWYVKCVLNIASVALRRYRRVVHGLFKRCFYLLHGKQ